MTPGRRRPVPTGLHENIDHIAVLIGDTPEVFALSDDCDEDFVQIPVRQLKLKLNEKLVKADMLKQIPDSSAVSRQRNAAMSPRLRRVCFGLRQNLAIRATRLSENGRRGIHRLRP